MKEGGERVDGREGEKVGGGEGLEEERERGTQVKYTTSECDKLSMTTLHDIIHSNFRPLSLELYHDQQLDNGKSIVYIPPPPTHTHTLTHQFCGKL